MFAKKNRLKKRDFKKLFKNSYKEKGRFFNIFWKKNDLGYNRYAVVIKNKIEPKAVRRNYSKRFIREILKKNDNNLIPNYDISCIIIKKIEKQKNKSEIEKDLLNLFSKLKK